MAKLPADSQENRQQALLPQARTFRECLPRVRTGHRTRVFDAQARL
jgi:hypothetical protein